MASPGWYYFDHHDAGVRHGPFSAPQLHKWHADGHLQDDFELYLAPHRLIDILQETGLAPGVVVAAEPVEKVAVAAEYAWVEKVAANSGRKYHVHTETGESVWVTPPFSPPPDHAKLSVSNANERLPLHSLASCSHTLSTPLSDKVSVTGSFKDAPPSGTTYHFKDGDKTKGYYSNLCPQIEINIHSAGSGDLKIKVSQPATPGPGSKFFFTVYRLPQHQLPGFRLSKLPLIKDACVTSPWGRTIGKATLPNAVAGLYVVTIQRAKCGDVGFTCEASLDGGEMTAICFPSMKEQLAIERAAPTLHGEDILAPLRYVSSPSLSYVCLPRTSSPRLTAHPPPARPHNLQLCPQHTDSARTQPYCRHS